MLMPPARCWRLLSVVEREVETYEPVHKHELQRPSHGTSPLHDKAKGQHSVHTVTAMASLAPCRNQQARLRRFENELRTPRCSTIVAGFLATAPHAIPQPSRMLAMSSSWPVTGAVTGPLSIGIAGTLDPG